MTSAVSEHSIQFEEMAALFACTPSHLEILDCRPSAAATRRAAELLELEKQGRFGGGLRYELDQFEQAELLMRRVKARMGAKQQ